MSLTPNEKDLLAKKSDLEGILKPDANDILHLPDITISLAENQQGYTTSGLSKDGLVFAGGGTITGITSSSGNSTTLAASQSAVSAKQDQLTAGTNITIQNNVISATGGGSNVTVTPIQNEGKQVATISVDGTSSTLYSGKTVYTGTTVPSASLGANDDLYIKYEGQGTTSFEDLTLTANTANQVPITNFSNYLTISFHLTSTNWSGYADVEEDIVDIPNYPSTITVFEYNAFNNVALSKYDNGIYIHLNGGIPNTVTQFTGTYASYEPTNEYIKINNEWQEISIGGGGASALANLTDVNITTPTDGQGLVYNNTTQKWENGNVSSASSIDTLTDVDLTNLSNGQILKYNSTTQKWENANESGGGGGTSNFTETSLFTGGVSGTTTFTLSDNFNNYDYIAIYYSNSDSTTNYQDIKLYPSSLLNAHIGDSVNILGLANDAWYYYFTVTSTTQLTYAKSNAGWITDIIGLKYGSSGGGSTTTVSVIPKVLTGTNIADITVGNGNTTDIYDYAYFDGSGYYETPFKVDTDHEYEIIFEANYDATMAVIGTYAGANYFHLTIYNNYWYVGTNSGEVHPSTYTTGKHTFKTDSSHTYLDDTQFTSYIPAVVNNYITIGARENTYLYKGKFYEFKIKSISTGNVLYDLVPGMRGTTKGLYDLISDTFVECSFISNMGTKTGTSGGVTTQLYAPSIEANPSGTATDSLSSIEINGTIYNIEGGGSGGNPELEETALLTTPITAEGTYTLLDNIEDYDFVSFVSGVSNEADIRLLAVSDMLNMLDDNLVINCAGTNGRWFNVTALSGTSITITKAGQTIIHSIMGYKIKGGGGGGDASPNITLLNDGTITDGQYVLSEPISNFDEINFIIQYRNEYINSKNYYPKDLLRLSSSSTDPYGVTNFLIEDYGQRYLYCQYIDETHIKPLEIFSVLKGIYGIKYKGGGGSSAMKLTQAEYDALTQEEKENGTIYFINDPVPEVKDPVQLIERVFAADSHITSSSSYSNDYPAWAAFNGTNSGGKRNPTTNTVWIAATGDTTPWIQYHFDEPYYLSKLEIHIYSHYSSDGNGYQGNLYILGSNDGSTWTNISSTGEAVTMDTGPSATSDSGSGLATVVKLEYDLNNSQKYEYIRLQGDEAWNVYYGIACDFDNIYVYGGTELDSSKKIYYMDTCYLDTNPTPTSSHNYSTAEQKIGTWIDGSPLYQKTIFTSSMSANTSAVIDASLTTNNIDYFMGSELSYIVNNSYRGSGYQIETKLTDNGVILDNNNVPSTVTSLSEIYTTVRYTKQAPKNITLLHFDNDLTDSCGTIWNIRNTAPVISTDQAKFGTSSLKFGGDGYIYSDVMTKFKFGTSDFTIDAWIYPTSTARQAFFSMAPVNGGDYRIGVDMFLGSSANQWFSTTGSNWSPINSDGSTGRGSIALSTGVWQHIALVRSGTRLITFIDGQIAKENTISASASVYWGGADTLRLGSWGTGGQNGGYLYSGYMDEFRVANYAAWTAAFTPPTEPYS